jgi:diguanylate cyclase (GGDEF)-like protein/PAS domain S-box-containing protein
MSVDPEPLVSSVQGVPRIESSQPTLNAIDLQTYRLIVDCATDMISVHDGDGLYLFVSPSSQDISGFEPREMLGKSPYAFFHPEDIDRITAHHMASLDSPTAPAITYRLRRKDGSYRFVETTSKTHTNAVGQKRTVCITRDMSERETLFQALERANEKLSEIASKDALTGVANRRAFNAQLTQLTASSQQGHGFALIVCDIDRFKRLNDAHGHQAGDETIIAVAHLLASQCRASDTVCRYGGEEFAILLPGSNLEGATGLAERMRAAIETSPLPYGDLTASFGVSEVNAQEDTAHAVFSRADGAFYLAKSNGRNRVETAT